MSTILNSANKNQLISTQPEQLSSSSTRTYLPENERLTDAILHILTEDQPLPPSRRLVIILPDAAFDIFVLARRIWNLAKTDNRQVLLLSKPVEQENLSQLRVTLSSLASLIRSSQIQVETQLVPGLPIEKAVLQFLQADDLLVCFAEHRISRLFKKTRLAEILAQTTGQPVYTLNGAVTELTVPFFAHLLGTLLLVACLASLAGFFILEVWLDQNTAGTFKIILQLITVFVEMCILAMCSNHTFKL